METHIICTSCFANYQKIHFTLGWKRGHCRYSKVKIKKRKDSQLSDSDSEENAKSPIGRHKKGAEQIFFCHGNDKTNRLRAQCQRFHTNTLVSETKGMRPKSCSGSDCPSTAEGRPSPGRGEKVKRSYSQQGGHIPLDGTWPFGD